MKTAREFCRDNLGDGADTSQTLFENQVAAIEARDREIRRLALMEGISRGYGIADGIELGRALDAASMTAK